MLKKLFEIVLTRFLIKVVPSSEVHFDFNFIFVFRVLFGAFGKRIQQSEHRSRLSFFVLLLVTLLEQRVHKVVRILNELKASTNIDEEIFIFTFGQVFNMLHSLAEEKLLVIVLKPLLLDFSAGTGFIVVLLVLHNAPPSRISKFMLARQQLLRFIVMQH